MRRLGLLGLLWAVFAVTAPAGGKELLKIVAFGDSTTALRETVKQVCAQRLAIELVRRSVPAEVINAGVPSNTTADALARTDRDVLAHKPDLVIVQFGLNDAAVDGWKKPPATKPRVALKDYERNLRTIIRKVRGQGAQIILMTPNPMRWTDEMRKLYGTAPYDPRDPEGFNLMVRQYVDRVRQIASDEKIPLVDVYAAFQEYGRRHGGAYDVLLSDGVHPTDEGHKIVADLLVSKIVELQGGRRGPATNQNK